MPTYLIFDTETTGLPVRNGPTDKYDDYSDVRLVEIAYCLCDEQGNTITSKSYIVKPDGFVISEEVTKIHGITHKHANENGQNILTVLNSIKDDFERTDSLVAHYIKYDYSVLMGECKRFNHPLGDIVKSKNLICTKELGREVLALNYRPRLVGLYELLFNKPFNQEHRALSDTEHCRDCFFELLKIKENQEECDNS